MHTRRFLFLLFASPAITRLAATSQFCFFFCFFPREYLFTYSSSHGAALYTTHKAEQTSHSVTGSTVTRLTVMMPRSPQTPNAAYVT